MNNYVETFTNEELITLLKQSSSLKQFIKKLGYKSTSDDVYNLVKEELSYRKINLDNFNLKNIKKTKLKEEDILKENSNVDQSTLRKYILKNNLLEYKCSICSLPPFWNNNPLILTLDHINGENHDNRIENLRWICPNCDRQLPTFGGKNQKKKIKNFCINCGKEISNYAIRCKKCSYNHSENIKFKEHQYKRKIIWPDKEKLLEMIKETNWEETGRKLGVTSNAIRKHLKNN